MDGQNGSSFAMSTDKVVESKSEVKGFAKLKQVFGFKSKSGYQTTKLKKEKSSGLLRRTKEKYSLLSGEVELPLKEKPSLAATLSRKISFKKLKKAKSGSKIVQSKIATPVIASPRTSVEELDYDRPEDDTPSSTETEEEVVVTTMGGGESDSDRQVTVSQLEATSVDGDLKPLDREPSTQSRASGARELTADVTSRIRAAWMSSESVAHMEVLAKPKSKGSKQVNIDSPKIKGSKQVSIDSPVESTPGSSKSEGFFTPLVSPMSSNDFDEDVSVETPKYTYKAPSVESPMTNGDDVMTEARARLSQSLGVANATATQHQVGDKREHLYKILVIGELGTGKTSIIKRYVHQFFSQHYRATIGVDFALKVLNWDANTIIRLQLWDIAGQERFGNMTRVYYKEAVGAFIVFDVTRAATFDAVLKWKQDLDSKVQLPDGSPIPCVLLANKCDQQKEGIVNQPGKMDEYCKERGFSDWFETSAKENINIEEAARSLVTKILQNDQVRIQSDSVKDGEKFNLDGNNVQDENPKGKCSC